MTKIPYPKSRESKIMNEPITNHCNHQNKKPLPPALADKVRSGEEMFICSDCKTFFVIVKPHKHQWFINDEDAAGTLNLCCTECHFVCTQGIVDCKGLANKHRWLIADNDGQKEISIYCTLCGYSSTISYPRLPLAEKGN